MPSSSQNLLLKYFQQHPSLSYRKKENVLRSEDTPQGIFFILNGYVKMNVTYPSGRELTVNIFKPSTYFPMMWALGDIPNNYDFQAMTPVLIHRSPKNEFLNFLGHNPNLLADLTRRAYIGLDGLITHISRLLTEDAYHRIIAALVMCSKRFGRKYSRNRIFIDLPLTHQDLADLAGVTASLTLEKLKQQKLINQESRHYIILKPGLLFP